MTSLVTALTLGCKLGRFCHIFAVALLRYNFKCPPSPVKKIFTRMWANAQRDGRTAEQRWRPLFNAAKFG